MTPSVARGSCFCPIPLLFPLPCLPLLHVSLALFEVRAFCDGNSCSMGVEKSPRRFWPIEGAGEASEALLLPLGKRY
ncbi:hypothetical protein HMPREF1556_01073 [Porphyromonas sp. oral taxon 278 str. W7784]|nr:hypothetical protein HMPREF1556_01073 [Porphyromonas sp. oral taxon 278 str. W7784]